MSLPDVSIVIIHYSNLQNVRECLKSLEKGTYQGPLHIILVDNAATEPAEILKQSFPQIEVTRLSENKGFTGGNNAGIRLALEKFHSEFVILLNDDTTVAPDFVSAFVNRLQSQPKAGAVAAKIYFSPGKEYHHDSYTPAQRGKVLWYAGGCIDWKEVVSWHRGVDEVDYGQYDLAEKTEFATGCCVAYRSSALKKVGLLDDDYFLYWEDTDLSLRLQRAGWETWYDPAAVIWHKNAGSSGAGSQLHAYYLLRNRLRFGFRFAPRRTQLFLLKYALHQLRSGQPVVKRAILDATLGHYGKHVFTS